MATIFEITILLVIALVGLFVIKQFNKQISYSELFDKYGDNVAILLGIVILVIGVIIANIFNWI